MTTLQALALADCHDEYDGMSDEEKLFALLVDVAAAYAEKTARHNAEGRLTADIGMVVQALEENLEMRFPKVNANAGDVATGELRYPIV